jgi:hypothetical protein
MSELPIPPEEALGPDELQRFSYACSHERRSHTTHRLIDAASYGWIHMFIRHHGEEARPRESGDDWLALHDADPVKIAAYFGRVAIRLRDTDAFDYATSLETYFDSLAEAHQLPWPHR